MNTTDEMVSRFLGWRLPDDFSPDCGITFKPPGHPNGWPVGTNLLTAPQAREMLEYVLQATDTTQLAEPERGHPDDAAVDAFAAAMKAKLAKKRAEGRGGWETCSAERLSEMLRDHVNKGDPVDVANLAMMLRQNGQSICSVSGFSEGMNLERLRRALTIKGIAAPESLEELAATLSRHVNVLTLNIAESKRKCDSNHGGPRCADPECWNDSPAMQAQDGPVLAEFVRALKLALEYWTDRQQRYRNRAPVWVQEARRLTDQFGAKPSESAAPATTRKAFICPSCEGVYADQPVSQCDCMPGRNEFIEGVIAYPAVAQPAASAEPMFWYRPRSDGGYEGPLHNERIEEVRKRCGAWVPLFAGRSTTEALSGSEDPLKSSLRPFSDEFKRWDGVGCWDSMTLDEMFSHAPGEVSGITFADLRRASEALGES